MNLLAISLMSLYIHQTHFSIARYLRCDHRFDFAVLIYLSQIILFSNANHQVFIGLKTQAFKFLFAFFQVFKSKKILDPINQLQFALSNLGSLVIKNRLSSQVLSYFQHSFWANFLHFSSFHCTISTFLTTFPHNFVVFFLHICQSFTFLFLYFFEFLQSTPFDIYFPFPFG